MNYMSRKNHDYLVELYIESSEIMQETVGREEAFMDCFYDSVFQSPNRVFRALAAMQLISVLQTIQDGFWVGKLASCFNETKSYSASSALEVLNYRTYERLERWDVNPVEVLTFLAIDAECPVNLKKAIIEFLKHAATNKNLEDFSEKAIMFPQLEPQHYLAKLNHKNLLIIKNLIERPEKYTMDTLHQLIFSNWELITTRCISIHFNLKPQVHLCEERTSSGLLELNMSEMLN